MNIYIYTYIYIWIYPARLIVRISDTNLLEASLIITMIKWIRTSRLPIKNSLYAAMGAHVSLLVGMMWEGCRASRRCSRDTFPKSYITKHTTITRRGVSRTRYTYCVCREHVTYCVTYCVCREHVTHTRS